MRIFNKPKKKIMTLEFKLPHAHYCNIMTGLASAFVANEDDELIVNTPILISSDYELKDGEQLPILECSVNMLYTHKDVKGLQKGNTLVYVSVIRLIGEKFILNSNK